MRNAAMSILAAWLLAAAAGCTLGTSGPSGPMPTWQTPEMLYLCPEPHRRLYVEIDTVQGAEPEEGAVASLRAFLEKHCDKPDGIQIARDAPIPLADVKGHHPEVVALLHMAGPPEQAGQAPPAYLYVLFYDSKALGQAGAVATPYVNLLYPCAILYDAAIFRKIPRGLAAALLRHEAGHLLGLCKNTDHGDGAHCRNKSCLMSCFTVSISRQLFGLPPRDRDKALCQECLADMGAVKDAGGDGRMSLHGPILVREEQGYWVGVLPRVVLLSFRPPPGRQWPWREPFDHSRQFARKYAKLDPKGSVFFTQAPLEAAGLREAVARAARDPYPSAARLAEKLLKRLGARQAQSRPSTQPVANRGGN